MDTLSHNKIAFQIAPKKRIWENIIMLFGTSGEDSTIPGSVSELKIWIPTQQYKTCPSVMDSSPFFYIFIKVYMAWYFPKLKY